MPLKLECPLRLATAAPSKLSIAAQAEFKATPRCGFELREPRRAEIVPQRSVALEGRSRDGQSASLRRSRELGSPIHPL
jgi:hypothetical protein